MLVWALLRFPVYACFRLAWTELLCPTYACVFRSFPVVHRLAVPVDDDQHSPWCLLSAPPGLPGYCAGMAGSHHLCGG